jgi:hypothetical protein
MEHTLPQEMRETDLISGQDNYNYARCSTVDPKVHRALSRACTAKDISIAHFMPRPGDPSTPILIVLGLAEPNSCVITFRYEFGSEWRLCNAND